MSLQTSQLIKVRQETTMYKIAIDFWSTKITIFLKIHINFFGVISELSRQVVIVCKTINMVEKHKVYGTSFSLLCMLCGVLVMVLYYQFRKDEDDVEKGVVTKYVPNSTKVKCNLLGYLGDGFCDDDANNEICDFDKGDCCNAKTDRSICSECFCFATPNPSPDCEEWYSCWEESGYTGDGICDDTLNTIECYFDGGDCCSDQDKYLCEDCVCVPTNLTCIEEELGDDICQDHNNFHQCDYDHGDCCKDLQFNSGLGSAGWNQCCNCQCNVFTGFKNK